jgi:hypothetical protein
MDYSSFFEDYLYGVLKGAYFSPSSLTVNKLTDSTYQVDISYGDEEIESYLDSGFNITLQINITDIDEVENAIGFEIDLINFVAPGVSETNSNYIDMSVALYREVANAAYSCINAINFGSDWVSLD